MTSWSGSRSGEVAKDAALAVLLAAGAVYLYWESLLVSWYNLDETTLLLQAHYFSPWHYFALPAVSQLVSSANLTPWVTASFDFDLMLFGPDPRAFHVHQLLDIALVAASSYLLMRTQSRRAAAGIFSGMLILTLPMAASSVGLPMRHYLEGLILTNLSLIFWAVGRASNQRQRRAALVASALFYALAMTAKEVFVPLIGFLLAAEHGGLRDRVRRLAPHAAAALSYLPWRFWMLGDPVGGYATGGVEDRAAMAARGAIDIVRSIPAALFHPPLVTWAVIAMFIGLAGLSAYQRRLRPVVVAVGGACLLAPVAAVGWLIPIFSLEGLLRYFLVIGWAAMVGLSFLVSQVSAVRVRAALLALAGLSGAWAFPGALAQTRLFMQRDARPLGECLSFIWRSGDEVVLDVPEALFVKDSFVAMAHFKRAYSGKAAPIIYAGRSVSPERLSEKRVYVQTRAGSCFEESEAAKQRLIQAATALVGDRPTGLTVRWGRDGFAWSWSGSAREVSGLVLMSAGGSVRIPAVGDSGEVASLRRMLFVYGVRSPASLIVEFAGAERNASHSSPIPLPEECFDFWQWARRDSAGSFGGLARE